MTVFKRVNLFSIGSTPSCTGVSYFDCVNYIAGMSDDKIWLIRVFSEKYNHLCSSEHYLVIMVLNADLIHLKSFKRKKLSVMYFCSKLNIGRDQG